MLSSLAAAQHATSTRRPASTRARAQWDLSCLNLDCKDGKGDIYAIPNDAGTYALFYNKALFKKAGVAKPPTTYSELLADCTKFKAEGHHPARLRRPRRLLDRQLGDVRLRRRTWRTGDIAKVNDGKLKYTDPKLVKPLQAARRSSSSRAASTPTRRRTRTTTRTRTSPPARPRWCRCSRSSSAFEKALGKNLGLAALPHVGQRPAPGKVAGNSFHNWVIPKNAKNPDGAWEFIKMAIDNDGRRQRSPRSSARRRRTWPRSKGMKDPLREVLRQAREQDPRCRCSTA